MLATARDDDKDIMAYNAQMNENMTYVESKLAGGEELHPRQEKLFQQVLRVANVSRVLIATTATYVP